MTQAMYDVEHLYNYFYGKLKYWTEERDQLQNRYNEAEAEYKKSLWYRLFKTEFKHTNAGNTSWLTGSWDFYRLELHVSRYQKALDATEYHMKMEDKKIPWMFDDLDVGYFYKHCKENKIPY